MEAIAGPEGAVIRIEAIGTVIFVSANPTGQSQGAGELPRHFAKGGLLLQIASVGIDTESTLAAAKEIRLRVAEPKIVIHQIVLELLGIKTGQEVPCAFEPGRQTHLTHGLAMIAVRVQ